MLTKTFLAATAIAMVAGVGSANAGGQFVTLRGIPAQVLPQSAMVEVRGSAQIIINRDGVLVHSQPLPSLVTTKICGAQLCIIDKSPPCFCGS